MADMKNHQKKLPIALLLMLVFLSCIHAYFAIKGTLPIATGYQDTQIFVQAAQKLDDSGELYTLTEPLEKTFSPARAVYKFPPSYVLAYMPWLSTLSASAENHAYEILFIFHIARYLIAMFLVGWFLGPRDNPIWRLGVIAMFLLASPVYESLYGMTFENLFFFMLVVSWVLIKYDCKWPVAAMLSYAALAKIYPAAQMLFFATRNRYRYLLYSVVAGITWLMISLYFLGSEPFHVYIATILPIILHEKVAHGAGNGSAVYAFFSAGLLRSFLISLIILITFVIINLKQANKNDNQNLFEYCLVISASLLLIPNCWLQYQIILLIPIAALLGSSLVNESRYRRLKLVIALAAWLPMISSENYSELNLPYYDKLYIKQHMWMLITDFVIIFFRTFSALLLWIGLAIILVLEFRHNKKSGVQKNY